MWCQELDTYTYISYIYNHPLGNHMDFLFSIGNTKNHVATLTCLEWLLKYVNISIILAPSWRHTYAPFYYNVGNYLYLNNGSFKSEVDLHQFNMRGKKKDFQKLAGLWLSGEMVNRIGIYGSKVAEGLSAFQPRSCYFCHCFSKWLPQHKVGKSFSAQVWEVFFKVAFIDEEAHIFVMRPQPLSHIDGPKPISNGQ